MTHTPTATVLYSFVHSDELRQYTVNSPRKYQQEVSYQIKTENAMFFQSHYSAPYM